MTGNSSVSIDVSVENIWKSWFLFRRGKRRTKELDIFEYVLEQHFDVLCTDLNDGSYRHGGYRRFVVTDNKRREICVASVCDRIVHRLVYEYLIALYDRTFIFDVWSCRKEKGLIGAIDRTQEFLWQHRKRFVWRADVRKFFDHVDHEVLQEILSLRVTDSFARALLTEIIDSYVVPARERERERERERVKRRAKKASRLGT
jgi:RNA-directed DNA polymerase